MPPRVLGVDLVPCCHPPAHRTAVWVQAATVGALMLPPVAAHRLQLSTQLCADVGARYAYAMTMLCAGVACILPPAMGADVLQLAARLPEPAAYHLFSGLMQLGLCVAAPLAVLARRELRARLLFASERGDAEVVECLHSWGQRWELSPIEMSLVVAAVLVPSLTAAAALNDVS